MVNSLWPFNSRLVHHFSCFGANPASKITVIHGRIDMKSMACILASVILCTVTFAGFSANAMADMKIGVVDIPRAIQATKEGQKIKKELDADYQRRKAELEKRKKEIDQMQADFDKKSLVLSDEARNEKEQAIEKAKMQFMQLRDQNLKALAQKDQQLSAPMLKRLGKVIDRIARRDDYMAIFHKDDQSLVWVARSIDITDEVIKELGKTK